jgi:Mor family transcriptional regulator
MTSEDTIDIKNILRDIESGENSSQSIIEKYNLTSYRYYRLLKEAGIKNPYSKLGAPPGPRNTDFKRLLNQSHGSAEPDINNFKEDCEKGMKLSELMEKYKLSLYQVRELRKKYGLTKTQ